MKKWFSLAVMALSALVLSSCTQNPSKQNIGTVAGGIAGGILGATVFHGDGQVAGVIGGTLLGGLLGNAIGKSMDRQDQLNMQQAIINTPVDDQASWTNERRHATYTVTPLRNYHHKGRYCREYETTVTIGGEKRKAYGKACRQPDGSWNIKS
jgi:surface antigen